MSASYPGNFPPDIITAAQASQQTWCIPASVTLAQWALESSWGRAMPEGSNNPFGIKAVAGEPFVTCQTREVINGASVMVPAKFRKFSSIDDAFDAHAKLLAQGRPYIAAMKHVEDPDAFALALTGVYATDPNYGVSLVRLMHVYALSRYDVSPSEQPSFVFD